MNSRKARQAAEKASKEAQVLAFRKEYIELSQQETRLTIESKHAKEQFETIDKWFNVLAFPMIIAGVWAFGATITLFDSNFTRRWETAGLAYLATYVFWQILHNIKPRYLSARNALVTITENIDAVIKRKSEVMAQLPPEQRPAVN